MQASRPQGAHSVATQTEGSLFAGASSQDAAPTWPQHPEGAAASMDTSMEPEAITVGDDANSACSTIPDGGMGACSPGNDEVSRSSQV